MNFYHHHHQYVLGVDQHSKDSYICLADKEQNILVHRKIGNRNTPILLKILEPYKGNIVVAAESSFAWYWLADLCEENGIEFILGHALYMKAIHGGKAQNDRIDSKKIAFLVQSGMFPLAYVYPKQKRSLRDLLRRRLYFVGIRSHLFSHIQLLNYQENLTPVRKLCRAKSNRVKLPQILNDPEHQKSAECDKDMANQLDLMIDRIELHILHKARDLHQKQVAILTSARGMGRISALTILLETNDIRRFPTHQNFASYCRLVKCAHESAGKKYGFKGVKIGNPYLKNIFVEAAISVARFTPRIGEYLDRLEKKHGKGKAKVVLAHKLCIAVYYMLKNETVFDEGYFLGTKIGHRGRALTA
jgi:transposase